MKAQKIRKEGNLTEIMSYGVVVINPSRISFRNINKGMKALLGKEINLKVVTIPY
jgi:hypothetical protein